MLVPKDLATTPEPLSGVAVQLSLRRVQERPADRLWQLHFCEPVGGIQVIFAAFVYDSNVSIFGCVLIRQYAIDLVQFQRGGVVPIVYANYEMCRRGFTSFHSHRPRSVSA